MKTLFKYLIALTVLSFWTQSCGDMNSGKSSNQGALSGNAAERVYVAPGEHDEYSRTCDEIVGTCAHWVLATDCTMDGGSRSGKCNFSQWHGSA